MTKTTFGRALGLAACLAFLLVQNRPALPDIAECALLPNGAEKRAARVAELIQKYGGEKFLAPDEVRPTSEATKHSLVVKMASNRLMGCDVLLRSYNGKLVGETIRARPGDTLHIRLINSLPNLTHPQKPPPHGHGESFNFNITNLHTHGLHTAPQGPMDASGAVPFESDNVLVELQPGSRQEYRIHIHDRHPAGTFWYHAHFHGSTALQLSSGMAGALIIDGGTTANGDLATVPELANVAEKVFVLQQFAYGELGSLESLRLEERLTTINGQLVPTIKMQPGEVQRWRFIHAGTEENIALALEGHPLFEVAVDGISLGRRVQWPDAETAKTLPNDSPHKLVLAPGYRTDVLVKARPLPSGKSRDVVRLLDLELSNGISIRAAETRAALATANAVAPLALGLQTAVPDKLEQVLATVVIEGEPMSMELPSQAALEKVTPADLTPITTKMIEDSPKHAQTVKLELSTGFRCQADGKCERCAQGDSDRECLTQRYMIDEHQFSETNKRYLKLDSVAEWTLTGLGAGRPERHPFHIHVNPFYYQRIEPDAPGGRNWVWKDTLLVPSPGGSGPEKVRMRYTRFKGQFVIHCHILHHEDRGMMQLVEIIP
jgi:FtsP/CotA-like multicopper oxidase with cupredoxin domain